MTTQFPLLTSLSLSINPTAAETQLKMLLPQYSIGATTYRNTTGQYFFATTGRQIYSTANPKGGTATLESAVSTGTIRGIAQTAEGLYITNDTRLRRFAAGSWQSLSSTTGVASKRTSSDLIQNITFGTLGELAYSESERTLFFTDTTNDSVYRMLADGRVFPLCYGSLEMTGIYEEREFPGTDVFIKAPHGITCAPDGTLFVTSPTTNRIYRLRKGYDTQNNIVYSVSIYAGLPRKAGTFDTNDTAKYAMLNSPTSIRYGEDGNLYFVNASTQVARITAEEYRTFFKGKTGALRYAPIQVIGNNTTEGEVYLDSDLKDAATMEFTSKSMVADEDGNLYFPDPRQGRIFRLDRNNQIKPIIDRLATDPIIPYTYITLYKNKILFVATDETPARLYRIPIPIGNTTTSATLVDGSYGALYGLYAKSNGVLFGLASNGLTYNLTILDQTIASGHTFTMLQPTSGIPTGICEDNANALYVCCKNNYMFKINPVFVGTSGITSAVSMSAAIAYLGGNTAIDPVNVVASPNQVNLTDPTGVAYSRAEHALYFTTYPTATVNRAVLYRTDLNTNLTTAHIGIDRRGYPVQGGSSGSTSLLGPTCVATDAQGNIYVMDNLTPDKPVKESSTILVRAPSKLFLQQEFVYNFIGTGILPTSDPNTSGALAFTSRIGYVRGMDTDYMGNIFFVDSVWHRVYRYDATTEKLQQIAGTGVAGTGADGVAATSSALNTPTHLCVSRSGTIYVYDSGNSRIRRLVFSSTSPTTYLSMGLISVGQVSGMAVDSNDTLYYSSGGTIRAITNLGRQQTIATGLGSIGGLSWSAQGLFAMDTAGSRILQFQSPLTNSTPTVYSIASGPTGPLSSDGLGNIYYIQQTHQVRRYTIGATPPVVEYIGKTTTADFSDGQTITAGIRDGRHKSECLLKNPQTLVVDHFSRLLIADCDGLRVRCIPTISQEPCGVRARYLGIEPAQPGGTTKITSINAYQFNNSGMSLYRTYGTGGQRVKGITFDLMDSSVGTGGTGPTGTDTTVLISKLVCKIDPTDTASIGSKLYLFNANWEIVSVRILTPLAATIGGETLIYALPWSQSCVDILGDDLLKTDCGLKGARTIVIKKDINGLLSFNGMGRTFLRFPYSSDTAIGTGDFTIECFVIIRNKGGETWNSIFNIQRLHLYIEKSILKLGAWSALLESNIYYTPFYERLTHIAIVRRNGVITMYINGRNVASQAVSTSYPAATDTPFNFIGTDVFSNSDTASSSKTLTGDLTQFHLVVGQALYTDTFIVNTNGNTVIQATPNTKLLLNVSSVDTAFTSTGSTLSLTAFYQRSDNTAINTIVSDATTLDNLRRSFYKPFIGSFIKRCVIVIKLDNSSIQTITDTFTTGSYTFSSATELIGLFIYRSAKLTDTGLEGLTVEVYNTNTIPAAASNLLQKKRLITANTENKFYEFFDFRKVISEYGCSTLDTLYQQGIQTNRIRYVRVYAGIGTNISGFTIAEIAAISLESGKNLARESYATVYTNRNRQISALNDGNLTAGVTLNADETWVELDLGIAAPLESVTVYPSPNTYLEYRIELYTETRDSIPVPSSANNPLSKRVKSIWIGGRTVPFPETPITDLNQGYNNSHIVFNKVGWVPVSSTSITRANSTTADFTAYSYYSGYSRDTVLNANSDNWYHSGSSNPREYAKYTLTTSTPINKFQIYTNTGNTPLRLYSAPILLLNESGNIITQVKPLGKNGPILPGSDRREVYYIEGIGGYTISKSDAASVCSSFGGQLATYAQLEEALRNGADWCATGWVSDRADAYYPINQSFQSGCGWGSGIVPYTPDYQKAGVNCYGVKPAVGTARVYSFRSGAWSMYDVENFKEEFNIPTPTSITFPIPGSKRGVQGVRFVRILVSNYDSNNKHIQISQLVVNDISGVNRALNRPESSVTYKSIYLSTNPSISDKMAPLDGRYYASNYIYHSNTMLIDTANPENGDFYKVDLGAEYEIDSVIYYNRIANMGRSFGGRVQLLNSSGGVIEERLLQGWFAREALDFRPEARELGTIRARYIRIENPGVLHSDNIPLNTNKTIQQTSVSIKNVKIYDLYNRNITPGKMASAYDAGTGTVDTSDGPQGPIQDFTTIFTTGSIPGSYWEVDLGQEYSIWKLTFGGAATNTSYRNAPVIIYDENHVPIKTFLCNSFVNQSNEYEIELGPIPFNYTDGKKPPQTGIWYDYTASGGTNMRFIHIDGYNGMDITQIMVIDKNGINVALGKPTKATAPAVGSTGTSYSPVNGLGDTIFRTDQGIQQTDGTFTYWEVDLGRTYTIHSIYVVYAKGIKQILCLDSLRNIVQTPYISTDYTNTIEKRAFQINNGTCLSLMPHKDTGLIDKQAVLARYVRLSKSNSNFCISQVAVIDIYSRNIALNKVPKTNTIVDSTKGPGKLVTGKYVVSTTSSSNCYLASQHPENWVDIDLGAEYPIADIIIYNSKEAPITSAQGIMITLRDSYRMVGGTTYTTSERIWDFTFTQMTQALNSGQSTCPSGYSKDPLNSSSSICYQNCVGNTSITGDFTRCYDTCNGTVDPTNVANCSRCPDYTTEVNGECKQTCENNPNILNGHGTTSPSNSSLCLDVCGTDTDGNKMRVNTENSMQCDTVPFDSGTFSAFIRSLYTGRDEYTAWCSERCSNLPNFQSSFNGFYSSAFDSLKSQSKVRRVYSMARGSRTLGTQAKIVETRARIPKATADLTLLTGYESVRFNVSGASITRNFQKLYNWTSSDPDFLRDSTNPQYVKGRYLVEVFNLLNSTTEIPYPLAAIPAPAAASCPIGYTLSNGTCYENTADGELLVGSTIYSACPSGYVVSSSNNLKCELPCRSGYQEINESGTLKCRENCASGFIQYEANADQCASDCSQSSDNTGKAMFTDPDYTNQCVTSKPTNSNTGAIYEKAIRWIGSAQYGWIWANKGVNTTFCSGSEVAITWSNWRYSGAYNKSGTLNTSFASWIPFDVKFDLNNTGRISGCHSINTLDFFSNDTTWRPYTQIYREIKSRDKYTKTISDRTSRTRLTATPS